MLKNYLKVALRSLRRRRLYTFVTLTGLTVGLACCLLIASYVHHERSYDRFHTKADRIYRIVSDYETPGERMQLLSPAPLAPALEADFPEVLETVRLAPARFLLAHGGRRFQEDDLRFADAAFFDVFDFPLQSGDPATALAAPGRIVLTASLVEKYFGGADPLGQTLLADGEHLLTVTGVMKDPPSNSHLRFDGLVSMATHEAREAWRFETFVSSINFSTYLLLPEGYDPADLAAKLPAFVERHTRQAFEEHGLQDNTLRYVLEPLPAIYLTRPRGEPRPSGSRADLYVFSAIGLLILLLACVNYMNLSTARSADRAREVGVRKVVGAPRRELVVQFLTESVLLVGCALVLALALAAAVLPSLRAFTGKGLSAGFLLEGPAVAGLVAAVVVVGLLAGSYPSLLLSGLRPAAVLKGSFAHSPRGLWLRRGLVVVQFAAAGVLLVGTLVVALQLDYLRSQRLGFRQEQMLVVDFHADPLVREQAERIKQELTAQPGVSGAAVSAYVPGASFDSFGRNMETGDGTWRNVSLKTYEVDYDFLPVYDIDLVAGRNFSPAFPGDSTRALLLNEAAARHLGFASPEEAVGASWGWGTDRSGGTIIGVVRDFHFRSLHEPVEPLAIQFLRFNPRYLTLRAETDRLDAVIAGLERAWQRLVPHRPLDHAFLDDTFEAQYRSDVRFGQLFGTFAGLAVFVACLGLFGLAAFTAEQRTKEIGVRKVLGASAASIVALLSKEFTRLVLFALLLAAPLAYFAAERWLEAFAYRIALGPGVFLVAGGGVLLVALLTVSYQSVRAALADPVRSLRYE